MHIYQTGWFGIPGRLGGKTHVLKNGKPLCGLHPHPAAEFQRCASEIVLQYIECRRCKERAANIVLPSRLMRLP